MSDTASAIQIRFYKLGKMPDKFLIGYSGFWQLFLDFVSLPPPPPNEDTMENFWSRKSML